MKDKVNETASVGSTSATGVAVRMDTHEKDAPKKRRLSDYVSNGKFANQIENEDLVVAESSNFSVNDILSKLSGMEKEGEAEADDGNITTFGIEDENGNLVKVTVRDSQAEEFEDKVASILGAVDTDDEMYQTSFEDDGSEYAYVGDDEEKVPSLPELIYSLKDEFDILDIEFPEIPNDAVYDEENITSDMENEFDSGMDDLEFGNDNIDGDDIGGDMNSELGDFNPDGGGEEMGDFGDDTVGDDLDDISDDGSVEDFGDDITAGDDEESLLKQLLQTLKAQAEASIEQAKAEAEQAKAKQAEYEAKATENAIKNQEELAQMELEVEKEKEKEKEAKQMADLAKQRVKSYDTMGEGYSLKDFFQKDSTIVEFDDMENEQTLRRQLALVNQKYTPSPEDTPDERQLKQVHKREETKVIRAKMRAARAQKIADQREMERDQQNRDQDGDQQQQQNNNQQNRNSDDGGIF